ncbi:FAD-dependent oxidoreductase [Afipia felis]|uniref:D-amino-acid oxidase n=2 Tax=Afipia felis TaxID=1035 RepID=A0A380W4E6_AFIFE|nr:FAD-dependent oxidoreductase [Afipia felis]EKS30981.1 glycine oxidase ThiO [Afipia felis ATCC 53690]SUU75725.1 D-amino acid dehydrogenase small subunit [Afipia felis]SUU83792.1 D-amino acid dehydrogenase small subunit [Afipia felis]
MTLKEPPSPKGVSSVTVIGAGVAGSWQALLFACAGYDVTLLDRDDIKMTYATSHWAGGMLAPWCEGEVSEPLITDLGTRSLELWRQHLPDTSFNGSLVVAQPRDRSDFERFARLTTGHDRLDANGVGELEPALYGRFHAGLFFAGEGHVEPRAVLPQLHARFVAAGGIIRFQSECDLDELALETEGIVIDCRGLSARDKFSDLRGVKGEMVVVEVQDFTLSRPVRLLHPRWPIYVIPRENNCFMIGATSIESEDTAVSLRSVVELLTAASTVHPAFGDAYILEIGAGLRPAFPDHLPRIVVSRRKISVNGLYRHGFLLAPALAEMTLSYVQRGFIHNEVMRSSFEVIS